MQKEVLTQFNSLYPKITLKEVSQKTGIQVTRIFRIFNGAEMKVSELEAFQKLIYEKLGTNLQDFQALTKKFYLSSSKEEISDLCFELEHILSISQTFKYA